MIKFARISKNGFLGRFGTVRPKSRKTGFFGINPAGSTFFEYCPPTSGQKLGKSLEPFSRNFRFTTIFGPFWAILGPFDPKSGKPDFSGEIRLCQFSSFIVPKLHAKNQIHPIRRFSEKVTGTQQTDQQYQP